MWIIHLGTLEKPIRGPFKTEVAARKWAEEEFSGFAVWHICKLKEV